ncbi:MAG TPA: cytochrome b/b6 domain-containing protein [Deltaproteobacteria bacterium]|nr:cytochrome b/b6 domain-containing protein [Deltaproteobacteria bacterium]
MSRKGPLKADLIRRHGIVVLLEHWAIAVSGLVLVITGIFELPIARRYYITELPGLAWSGDYMTSLALHYAASVVFVGASVFHVVYHGIMGHRSILPRRGDLAESWQVIKGFIGKAQEPPFHKYLPEQRLAYAAIAVIIAGLVASGIVKTWKNLFAPDMDYTLVLWATWAHNLFFVLFVLAFFAHMAAIVIKPNRPLIRAIFTGRVRRDYAEHRHPLWFAEIMGERGGGTGEQAGASPEDGEKGDNFGLDAQEGNGEPAHDKGGS